MLCKQKNHHFLAGKSLKLPDKISLMATFIKLLLKLLIHS